jgi:hypothetical protein
VGYQALNIGNCVKDFLAGSAKKIELCAACLWTIATEFHALLQNMTPLVTSCYVFLSVMNKNDIVIRTVERRNRKFVLALLKT